MKRRPQPHQPVLLHSVLAFLQPKSDGLYVDGTVGAGGHAAAILAASSPGGMLLGLDLDGQAMEIARWNLVEYGMRAQLRQASYLSIPEQLASLGWQAVDGILLDLGVSSMQLDQAEKGFSFQADGPLDMRFDESGTRSAADLVNDLTERDLADVIYRYGEERYARRVAHAIVRKRPLRSTVQLAAVVAGAIGGKRQNIHPATRTFQALRIAVNEELPTLEKALPVCAAALKPGGRLVVISFHSLEDRLVKHFFRQESRNCLCDPHQPVCTCNHQASLRIITPHPVEADENETSQNVRARSAKLRVAEKLAYTLHDLRDTKP
jgi:16S rRNA (cytosine1402-N4)-methyltransferase